MRSVLHDAGIPQFFEDPEFIPEAQIDGAGTHLVAVQRIDLDNAPRWPFRSSSLVKTPSCVPPFSDGQRWREGEGG